MPKRLLFLALILGGCGKSGRDAGARLAADSKSAQARAQTAVAFRIPVRGGPLDIYSLPSLDTTLGGGGSRLSGARSAVGVDIPGRRLLFLDSTGAIASFDLVSLRQKVVGPRHASATIGADGSLLAVDSSGAVTESQPWGTRTWPGSLGRGVTHIFAAPGPRLIVIRHTVAGDSLAVVARENGTAQSLAVPTAVDEVASRDGDAVAFATDSGLVVFEDREMDRPWFIRLEGTPRAVIFSPSGHRLYVALRDRNEIAVVDRFTHRERAAVSLPGPAAALRADPWGRAVLARAAAERGVGDTWVVGVASNSVVGRFRGTWSSDLPAAAEGGVILSREGTSIVARDIHSLDSLAAVADGARDLWFAGRWAPTSATAAMRAAAAQADAGQRAADGGKTAAVLPPAADRQAPTASRQPATADRKALVADQARAGFWIQLTSTSSESAAHTLVAELHSPYAQVVTPRTEDDTWRVMVGPFWTREAADSAGRSIGRPYWVVDRSREARN